MPPSPLGLNQIGITSITKLIYIEKEENKELKSHPKFKLLSSLKSDIELQVIVLIY
jgi:hypothetical protein